MGQPRHPVDNIDDALVICAQRNIGQIFLADGDFTPNNSLDELIIIGKNPGSCSLDLNNQSVNNLTCHGLVVYGEGTGDYLFIFNGVIARVDKSQLIFDGNVYTIETEIGAQGVSCTYFFMANGTSSNRFMPSADKDPVISAERVQILSSSGDFYIDDLQTVTSPFAFVSKIFLTSGSITFKPNCNTNNIEVYGNAEIINEADISYDDYTLQGREKGLNNIYDEVKGVKEDVAVTQGTIESSTSEQVVYTSIDTTPFKFLGGWISLDEMDGDIVVIREYIYDGSDFVLRETDEISDPSLYRMKEFNEKIVEGIQITIERTDGSDRDYKYMFSKVG